MWVRKTENIWNNHIAVHYKFAQGPHDSTQKSLEIRVNIYIDIIHSWSILRWNRHESPIQMLETEPAFCIRTPE